MYFLPWMKEYSYPMLEALILQALSTAFKQQCISYLHLSVSLYFNSRRSKHIVHRHIKWNIRQRCFMTQEHIIFHIISWSQVIDAYSVYHIFQYAFRKDVLYQSWLTKSWMTWVWLLIETEICLLNNVHPGDWANSSSVQWVLGFFCLMPRPEMLGVLSPHSLYTFMV